MVNQSEEDTATFLYAGNKANSVVKEFHTTNINAKGITPNPK